MSGQCAGAHVDREFKIESGLAPIPDHCTEEKFVLDLQRKLATATQEDHVQVDILFIVIRLFKNF